MRVAVFGQGYVGLPLAMAAAAAGHHVIGFDLDAGKTAGLRAGQSHITDVPDAEIQRHLELGRYLPTSDIDQLAGYDIAVITVPTPLTDGVPDVSYIEAAADVAGYFLTEGSTVVLESTTFPGTTREIMLPRLEKESGLAPGQFHCGYSPERVDPGNQQWTLTTTPKIVSGMDDASLDAVDAFYISLGAPTVRVGTPEEAELAKIYENTFRQVNCALVNELAQHAHTLGINSRNVLKAAHTKPFGIMPFHPGPGTGGHCLPVDPEYLAWLLRTTHGQRFEMIEVANRVNHEQPDYVVRRFVEGLRNQGTSILGAKVAVLGYAYKPNTPDCRDTPASRIVDLLVEEGMEIVVFEPHAMLTILGAVSAHRVPSISDIRWADGVLVVTDHAEFNFAEIGENARYVLDTRNRVPAGEHVDTI